MGLGDWLIKRTAKSTANSMGKYVKSGLYGDGIDSLRAWSMTRSNSMKLLSMIDTMTSISLPSGAVEATTVARVLFDFEMGIESGSLSSQVDHEIRLIFKKELG